MGKFFLDKTLMNILVDETSGHTHAMKDIILYEYVLGANFTKVDWVTHFKGVFDYHQQEGTIPRSTGGAVSSIEMAFKQLHFITTRWLFPRREFMGEVVALLYKMANMCSKWADASKEVKTFDGSLYRSKTTAHLKWLAEIYQLIPSTYLNKEANTGFKSFLDLKNFLDAFTKDHLSYRVVKENRHDPQVTAYVWGWNAKRDIPGDSLCAQLLRFINGFVNHCERRKVPEEAQYKAAWETLVPTTGVSDEHFVFPNMWEYSASDPDFYNVKNWEEHGVGRSYERLKKVTLNMRGPKDIMAKLVESQDDRNKVDWAALRQGLFLSGYQREVVDGALKRVAAGLQKTGETNCWIDQDLKMATEDYVEIKRNERGDVAYVPFKFTEGDWVPESNFSTIMDKVQTLMAQDVRLRPTATTGRMVQADDEKETPEQRSQKTAERLAASYALQSDQAEEEKKEDGDSNTPLLLGAALLAAFALSR